MKKEIVLISENKTLALSLGMHLTGMEQDGVLIRVVLFGSYEEYKSRYNKVSLYSPDLIIFVCNYSDIGKIKSIKQADAPDFETPLIFLSAFTNSEIQALTNKFTHCNFIFKANGWANELKEKVIFILGFQEQKFNTAYGT